MPLKFLFIYSPRHFSEALLSIRYKTLLSFLNDFHAFINLCNIDFALSCMDVLATNTQISRYRPSMPNFVKLKHRISK